MNPAFLLITCTVLNGFSWLESPWVRDPLDEQKELTEDSWEASTRAAFHFPVRSDVGKIVRRLSSASLKAHFMLHKPRPYAAGSSFRKAEVLERLRLEFPDDFHTQDGCELSG